MSKAENGAHELIIRTNGIVKRENSDRLGITLHSVSETLVRIHLLSSLSTNSKQRPKNMLLVRTYPRTRCDKIHKSDKDAFTFNDLKAIAAPN